MLRSLKMSKCRKQIIGAVGVIILIAGLSWSAPQEIKTLGIGDTAPDFSLPGVDGRRYRLADFDRAETLVIVFTSIFLSTKMNLPH